MDGYEWNNTVGSFSAAIAGVPEPATWAIKLVGFGGLGAVIRSTADTHAAVRPLRPPFGSFALPCVTNRHRDLRPVDRTAFCRVDRQGPRPADKPCPLARRAFLQDASLALVLVSGLDFTVRGQHDREQALVSHILAIVS